MSRMLDDAPDQPVDFRAVQGHRDLGVLIHLSAGTDEQAFMELYDATASRVYGLAVRVLRSPTLAEEAALETYLEVWRTSARFDTDRCSPLAWILVTVLQRVLDRLRPACDAVHVPANAPAYTLDEDAPHEHRTTSAAEHPLREALASLSSGQLEALLLACREEYDAESVHLTAILSTLVSTQAQATPDLAPDPRFGGS